MIPFPIYHKIMFSNCILFKLIELYKHEFACHSTMIIKQTILIICYMTFGPFVTFAQLQPTLQLCRQYFTYRTNQQNGQKMAIVTTPPTRFEDTIELTIVFTLNGRYTKVIYLNDLFFLIFYLFLFVLEIQRKN